MISKIFSFFSNKKPKSEEKKFEDLQLHPCYTVGFFLNKSMTAYLRCDSGTEFFWFGENITVECDGGNIQIKIKKGWYAEFRDTIASSPYYKEFRKRLREKAKNLCFGGT